MRRAFAVIAMAALSIAAWRVEVEVIKGWGGRAWLRGYPWAAAVVCLCVASSVLVVARPTRVSWRWRAVFLVLATSVCWAAFEIARRALLEDRMWLAFGDTGSGWRIVGALAAALVLAAAGLQQCVHRLVAPLGAGGAMAIAAAIVVAWPLAIATIRLLPAHGYTDDIHAIKAGYPMFWVDLTVATAVGLARRARDAADRPPREMRREA